MPMDSKKRRRIKRQRYLIALLAVIVIICATAGGSAWYRTNIAGQVYAEIRENSKTAATDAVGSTSATALQASAEENPIDFRSLRETCPDAYAWICIPDTQIDYPVCQMAEGDQSFYLNHRADKTPESVGAIYSENYNTRDFTDPVTVLYGHDMANGSMFQNLHLYEDRDFFNRNREVLIYLPDRVLHYEVFAAYEAGDEHLLTDNDCFRDPDAFSRYLQDIQSRGTRTGLVDQNVKLTGESRILTLSTCGDCDDQRCLVQCLLVDQNGDGSQVSQVPADIVHASGQ